MLDYDAACAAATTAQGLDPLLDALDNERLVHGVAQTGGFCMVVTVPHETGVWGIIDDGDWLAVWYPGTSWQDGAQEEGPSKSLKTVGEVIELVARPHEG